jgi:hypothetical protein
LFRRALWNHKAPASIQLRALGIDLFLHQQGFDTTMPAQSRPVFLA